MSEAAHRIVIDEPTTAAPQRPAEAADAAIDHDEEWGIEAIAKRAAETPDGAISTLVGLYHHARLSDGMAEQRVKDVERQAELLYPDQPVELRSADGPRLYPARDWPEWKKAMHDRWATQCRLIDKGLGLDTEQAARDRVSSLMDDLARRVLEAPVTTVSDVNDKLGVISWRLDLDVLEPKEASSLIWQVMKELEATWPTAFGI